jgi:hypothetical protein
MVFFYEVFFLIVIKAFPFFLLVVCNLASRNIPNIPSVSYGYSCLLVHFVWIVLFPRLETVMTVSFLLFGLFLGSAPEIIVEADNGLDKVVYRIGELLNRYNVLNISFQSFIKLGYLSAFVLRYLKRILREACKVLGDRSFLFYYCKL